VRAAPVSDLHAALPRTFAALLGRFPRLFPVQAQGVPPVLAGRDTLLSAPSASGKTEAYLAPLTERLLAGGERGGARVLIVSPTRALANDLHRRLEGPLARLGVSFGRHTGEHKERAGGALPEMAVITPEALDSLLARRSAALGGVCAVVVDEIHLLDGTARGDQLRVLLHRLSTEARAPVQRVAASATVTRARALAERYLQDPVLVEVPGTRRIYARGFEGRDGEALAGHLGELAAHGFRKILAFANSRNEVERVAAALLRRTPFGDAVFAHHGSLSQAQRERTEHRFWEAPAALAVATLTLELGLDIGTVDYVLLLTVPPGVDSLLQRIGRGNRRTGMSRVGYVYESEAERLLYRVLVERAVRGDLCAAPYALRPGVLVQQALVMAGGAGYVNADGLARAIPPSMRRELPEDAPAAILERAAEAGLLERAPGARYVLGEGAERRYAAGRLHGNIDSPREVDVVDRLTGEVVGRIAGGPEPPELRLGGRGRRLVVARAGQVLTDSVGGGGAARFAAHGVPPVSFALARAVTAALGLAPGEVAWARTEAGCLVLHGLGTAGALLLGQLVAERLGKRRVLRVTPFTLLLSRAPGALPRPDPAQVTRVLGAREGRLARLCAMGPYHRHLPSGMRRAAVRAAADLDHIAAFLAGAGMREVAPAPRLWLDL
jgi:ATP-dependent Lhr-like helicase